jgi:drug/metabolite transporter (DMT)-like permease
MDSSPKVWLVFVVLAGLCWGVYVPLVFQGGKELKSPYGGFLCVGIAYFLIAILFPLGLFWIRGKFPEFTVPGVTLATLAGAAGAVGALCVILATVEFKGNRLLVAPLIFAMAPVINTLVSLIWHPSKGYFHFGLEEAPDWKLFVGVVLTGLGAFLVLQSKEQVEAGAASKKAAVAPMVAGSEEPAKPG